MRGLGAVAFWDKKCRGKKMQKCRNARIVVAVVRSERGYVGFASWLSHNLLTLASLRYRIPK